MTRRVGLLLLVAAVATTALGAVWIGLDAIGTEWDFCPRGSDCVDGWLMGISLVALGAAAGLLGLRLARAH